MLDVTSITPKSRRAKECLLVYMKFSAVCFGSLLPVDISIAADYF